VTRRKAAKLYILLGLPIVGWVVPGLMIGRGVAGIAVMVTVALAYMILLHLFECPACKASLFTRRGHFFGVGWPCKTCWRCGHKLEG
jgi:hypothetical protein